MRFMKLAILWAAICAASITAQDAAPSALQKKLIGHWIAEKDNKLHTYYSQKLRLMDRDIANSDARFDMTDYQVWDEWPELRTIIISMSIGEATQVPVLIVITFSEDGQSAVCREKSLTAWSKSFRIQRVDDKTHPSKIPEKIKILDLDSGVGPGQ